MAIDWRRLSGDSCEQQSKGYKRYQVTTDVKVRASPYHCNFCNGVTLLTSFVKMIPSALEHLQEIAGRSARAAVFLDCEGTLPPIVSQPEDAWLSDSMRQTLRELAARGPVAILSGRDLDDVRRRVNI